MLGIVPGYGSVNVLVAVIVTVSIWSPFCKVSGTLYETEESYLKFSIDPYLSPYPHCPAQFHFALFTS